MDWSAQRSDILSALWGGEHPLVVVDAASSAAPPEHGISVAVDRGGQLPAIDPRFDIALTTAADAPGPWVFIPRGAVDDALAKLALRTRAATVAALTLRWVMRLSPTLSFLDALAVESLAYSTLLASAEFKHWRAGHPAAARKSGDARVNLSEHDGLWVVELNRVDARNAVDAPTRDALVDALQAVAADARGGAVELRGAGPAFCAGGDLNEFGSAADPGLAHWIRIRQSPTKLIQAMRQRVTARVHGACIGAGVEMPAAAGRVVAAPDAFFRLLEIGMGLVPGAGGCASIPRRIGAQRALYLALSGEAIDAATARHWGLVDFIVGAAGDR